MPEKNDIENREDIMYLIRSFYTQAMQDELIGAFFTEVAAINLEEHLPIMGDFWENLLFHTGAYHGGMMQKHFRINSKKNLEAEHFARWLELFEAEVDKHFVGPMAEEAKSRAKTIAPSMHMRLNRSLLPISWL
jgi:hemoglobin